MSSSLMVLAIALLGGLGAVCRFAIHNSIVRANANYFPLGTFAVNISGSLVAGMLLGAAAGHNTHWLIGAAFLGAFTTFSTWMFESERLAVDGYARAAAANIVLSSVLGLGAVALGVKLGELL